MIRLLREDRLTAEFIKLSRTSKALSFAAPFWGAGAARSLGLKAGRKVRVLCRFDAQACNPKALAELAKAGASIRSHPRLHAKVYLADGIAVVGSSNPSRYGLTQEGDVIGGTVEANLLTDDPDIVRSVEALFEELWRDEDETCRVSMRMIEREIRRRELTPPPPVRRALRARTLLTACKEAPELFSSVLVCAYDSGLAEGGRKALRQLQRQASDDGAALGISSFRRCWGYQFEEPPPGGSWIVDLDCKGNVPKVHGASKVPSPALRLKVEDENDLTPTVRGVVTVPGARGEFRISKQDRADLAGVADALLDSGQDFVPLADAVALIDDGARQRNQGRGSRRRRMKT